MISTARRILMSVAVCILVSASCAVALQDASETSPIEALRALYNDNKEFRTTMDRAFVHMKDPDPETADLWPNPTDVNPWKGKEFDDLLLFFDEWYHLLPTPSGAQDEFNYIEKFAWFYYNNEYGQQIVGEDPGLSWTRDFVEARRKFLESPESTGTIQQWIDDPAIHIEQYIVPPDGFKSFNEFFIRDLKPGTRTVASPTDDSVLVSPTDCVLNMINPLTPGVRIPTKLDQQLNVKELLAGSEYAKYFETGTATSCILLPTTYHHYHAVVSGKVVESREDVAGAYWGIEDFGTFYNTGNIGYGADFSVFEQFRRGYFVIQTEEYGYVAMIPVGLDTIGSVAFEDKYKNVTPENPVPVYKGEKLGHFEYGGSMVITLVEQGISSITIPQGQQIGVFGQKKTQAPAPTEVPPTETPVPPEAPAPTEVPPTEAPAASEAPTPATANPASENCVRQGGTHNTEERGDGGEIGVCTFEDNRQCEEGALLIGYCPVGGVRVTGYVTPASRYCAITGGAYAVTGSSNTEDEQGTCTYKNGVVCDVWDAYNGKCSADQAQLFPASLNLPGGGSGMLVFDSTRGGPYRDLYQINSDGTNVFRLTEGEANSFAGPYSPDGQRIVYTTFGPINSYIAVMNADGSGQTILDRIEGSDEAFPDWSPDGQRIAFTSRRDGNNEIYLMNADGSNPVRLTDQPGDDFAPSWSPDGTQIVFVSDRDPHAGFYDLYIMNADGSGIQRLTHDTAIDYSPDWSPDGKTIVFRSHHDGPGDIYVINVDGTGLTNLTKNPAEDWAPTWSPDGSLIAFQTNRDGNWEIYLMAADGWGPVNLTNDPADDQLPYWHQISSSALAAASGPPITARMLVEPYALMGPGPSGFSWSPNGAILAYIEPQDGRDVLWAYDATTSEKWALLDPGDNPDQIDLSSAQWSPQGDSLLLSGGTALWLLDAETGELRSLAEGRAGITSLTFSPDGTRIAFVQDNDLYTIGVNDGKIARLTTDGSETVFNGTLDWVYNEELATRSSQPAYAWSADGKWLIHLRLDEAEVQNHSVTDYRPVPPTLSYTRYPAADSPNPKASLHMIALDSGQSSPVPLPADAEYVLPFFTWFPDSQEAVYVTVNRAHSSLELTAWNPAAGTARTLVKETDPAWVNEHAYAAPMFLGDGSQFLWLSERDGFMHLYLYSRQGELIRQLTEGEWMIDSPAWNLLIPGRPVYVDPAGNWAYFSCTKNSPLERQIYRVKISSGALEQVSQPAGFHLGALSGDGQYLVDQYSDVSTPPVTKVLKADGTELSVLSQSAGPALDLPEVAREYVIIKAHDGVDLYGQIVKPENFNPMQKYPVIVHWYAGPTLQMVSNRYGKTNLFNHIERDVLYTQAGFIVWRLDSRGSFGRGHAFQTPIAGELGKAELDDQLAGIEWLQALGYIDASRIGCDGKSYGGYMSLYALIHATDVFKAGVVASAPTSWLYYDTIYTERYMGTPSQNPEGYAATDLIAAADQIQVRPLIIHGLNDTNVHLQNSINLIQELEALDKPFDFLPLPNLNHSYKGDGLVTALSASVEYFIHTLGNGQ